MSELRPEISGSSIILVGSLNPAIFQPQWFVRQGLLSEEEGETADVKVISQQVSQFETTEIIVQVLENRFAVVSKPNADPTRLKDFVKGTFDILEHTPLQAMGLNHQMHYALGSEEAWHRVGDRLAPKEAWRQVMKARPGMRSIAIQSDETSEGGPRLLVRVEPSLQVKFGVFFDTNAHYDASEGSRADYLMGILVKQWEQIPSNASRIAEHILDWARAD